MITAMILAGGTGSRVGADRPKQFIEVLEKPVLAYTIELYENNSNVDNIEVVCHSEWIDYLKEMINKYNYKKVKWIASGGETFQASVINGMNNLKDKVLNDDIVLIHYGAAPFTSQDIINDVIKVTSENSMAVSCTPCYQLMGTNDGNISNNWVDRDKIVQIACPQGFKYNKLLSIYKQAEEKGLLNKIEPHTTSLMYALNIPIYKAYGNQTNIKITTKEDLYMFEGYVLMKNKSKLL
jgi:2-C-methyl-D-erythritol 4-phosphate cytidylyltransferase